MPTKEQERKALAKIESICFHFANSTDYANGIMTVTIYKAVNNWDEIKMGTREARKLYFKLIDEAREEARNEEEMTA